MNASIVVRSVVATLFVGAICHWTWQLTFPEEFARRRDSTIIIRSQPTIGNLAMLGMPNWEQLPVRWLYWDELKGFTPTSWLDATHLVPTELETEALPVCRDLFDVSPTLPHEDANFFYNRQLYSLTPRPLQVESQPLWTDFCFVANDLNLRGINAKIAGRMTKISRGAKVAKSVTQPWPQTKASSQEAIPQ